MYKSTTTRFSFIVLLFFVVFNLGCALPPKDNSGQSFVPEEDLSALKYTSLGMQEVARGRFLQGEMSLYKALQFAPSSEKIKLNIAVALYGQERFDEALSYLEPLHLSDPINPSYKLWYAKSLIGAGAITLADEVLESGIDQYRKLNDLQSVANFARTQANAKYRIGDFDAAICASQIALSATTNAVEFLNHVKLLMQTGRLKSAEWFLRSGMAYGGASASTSTVEYQMRLAELEYILGNYESAKSALQNVLSRGTIADSTTAYESKLLIIIVGNKIKNLEQDVDISLLDDNQAVDDILADPRQKFSPLSLVLFE
jgi:tetratricopeptide (TPR) repeat protein